MLLLISGSGDGTSNMLCHSLDASVFRLNYDLFPEYKISFSPHSWEILNPAGHSITSDNVTSVFWWKAFNFFITSSDSFIVEEMKYTLRELYNWGRLRGLTRGNPPDFHNRFGKINILSIARDYFSVPDTAVYSGFREGLPHSAGDMVAKSLSSGAFDSQKVLFTSQVNTEELDGSYLWFLQAKVESDFDITVFICGSSIFAFSRSRSQLRGLDWRAEQSFDVSANEWSPFQLSESETASVQGFCGALKVEWGRLDLLTTKNGLVFLEFNANGQFMFLDYFNAHGMHDAVIKYVTSQR